MKRARRYGTSLAELLIGLSLLILILTLCTQIFMSSWRRFHAINLTQDLQNTTVSGMDRLSRDFTETTIDFVRYANSTDSSYLYFPTARDIRGSFLYSTDLKPIWQGWVIYYVFKPPGPQSSACLARKWVPGDLFSPPNVLAEKANLARSQVVTRYVKSFIISHTVISNSLYSYDIVLETEKDAFNQKQRFRVSKTWLCRDLFNREPPF